MELDMTKGKPLQLMVKFMIPLIIGNIFQQFYSMVDTIIVGKYVGVQALAAVGATGTISFLILGFMQGITTGFTVLSAQRFGAGDIEGVKSSVGNAYLLSIGVTVVMTFVSVACMDGLLRLMHTPEDIFAMSKEYIMIICWGMGCNILYNLLASVLRAVGNSKVPLYFLVLSAVLNIILDLVFILNFGMGVAGAAVATVISQGVSGILCFIYMVRKVPLLRVEKRHLKPDFYCIRNEMSIGLPMALQFSITAVGTIMVQSALNMLGSTVVAAYTAACKVEQLMTQPFLAVGVTMATYCAQNRGINDFHRIRAGVKIANVISAIYAVVIAVVLVNTFHYIIPLFVSENLEVITEYGRTYMMVCGSFFIPLGMIYIFRNGLQGCGFALIPMLGGVMELVSRAVMAFVAARHESFIGVCFANAMAWLTTGIFLWVAYLIIMKKAQKRYEDNVKLNAQVSR